MRVLNILSIALGLLLTSNCLADYSGTPIQGWVVDDETGEPLEGVIIVATSNVNVGTLAGTNDGGQIQIMEAVTNQTGEYFFPAWGPKPLPRRKWSLWEDQYIDSSSPVLEYFKSGYQIKEISNTLTTERMTGNVIKSQWSDQTIRLKKFTGSLEDYANGLWQATPTFITLGQNCEWQKIPRFVAAFINETNRFRSLGIKVVSHLAIESLPITKQCTNPYAYLQKYGLDSDYIPDKDRPMRIEVRSWQSIDGGGASQNNGFGPRNGNN